MTALRKAAAWAVLLIVGGAAVALLGYIVWLSPGLRFLMCIVGFALAVGLSVTWAINALWPGFFESVHYSDYDGY